MIGKLCCGDDCYREYFTCSKSSSSTKVVTISVSFEVGTGVKQRCREDALARVVIEPDHEYAHRHCAETIPGDPSWCDGCPYLAQVKWEQYRGEDALDRPRARAMAKADPAGGHDLVDGEGRMFRFQSVDRGGRGQQGRDAIHGPPRFGDEEAHIGLVEIVEVLVVAVHAYPRAGKVGNPSIHPSDLSLPSLSLTHKLP